MFATTATVVILFPAVVRCLNACVYDFLRRNVLATQLVIVYAPGGPCGSCAATLRLASTCVHQRCFCGFAKSAAASNVTILMGATDPQFRDPWFGEGPDRFKRPSFGAHDEQYATRRSKVSERRLEKAGFADNRYVTITVDWFVVLSMQRFPNLPSGTNPYFCYCTLELETETLVAEIHKTPCIWRDLSY
jgi:hypothetical protein